MPVASPASLIPRDPTDVKQTSTAASSAAGSLLTTGSSLTRQGSEGLAPVFDRLTKLLSGNSSAIDSATQPEVASVLRQYDTARRNSSEFAPRGGGKTSAMVSSNAQEASDISQTKNKAVNDASTQLAQLASTLTGQGISASEGGTAGLMNLVQSALSGEQLSTEKWGMLGTGLGKLVASIFFPPAAA
jgi:hypothetical protein